MSEHGRATPTADGADEPTDSPGPARIEPGGRGDIGSLNWVVSWVSGRVAGTGPPNLFRVLGRNRGLFRGWLHFAGKMMPGGRLPRRDTELVILRVAHHTGCTYEQEHHRSLARRAGVSPAEIERVAEPGLDGWSDRDATLLAVTDQRLGTGDLDDETWDRLRRLLDERTTIELLLLIGHYEMLAKTIITLRIPLDAPRRRGSR